LITDIRMENNLSNNTMYSTCICVRLHVIKLYVVIEFIMGNALLSNKKFENLKMATLCMTNIQYRLCSGTLYRKQQGNY